MRQDKINYKFKEDSNKLWYDNNQVFIYSDKWLFHRFEIILRDIKKDIPYHEIYFIDGAIFHSSLNKYYALSGKLHEKWATA